MSRHHVKISPRNEQRTRKNQNSSKSGYFVLLLIMIVGITCYYAFSRGLVSPINNTSPATENTIPPKPSAPKAPPKPRFEFYTLLSKETVPIPHEKKPTADVTTDTLPPEESKPKVTSQEIVQEEPAAAPTGVPSIPVHNAMQNLPASQTLDTTTATASPGKVAPEKVTSVTPTPASPPQTKQARYVLQVAALQHRSDVERLKAQLSLLGFDVFVEPFKSYGVEWYRVKTGPYASYEAMQKARQVLVNNHLSSILITLPPK